MSEQKKTSKYSKAQRIAAIGCVIIIVLLYLATLIFNLINASWAKAFGRATLMLTLILPILAWGYIWMIGVIFHKHTIADLDLGGIPTDHSGVSIDTNAADKNADDAE